MKVERVVKNFMAGKGSWWVCYKKEKSRYRATTKGRIDEARIVAEKEVMEKKEGEE